MHDGAREDPESAAFTRFEGTVAAGSKGGAATHDLVRLVLVAGVSRRRCLLVCFGCHSVLDALSRVPLWLRGAKSRSKQGRRPRVPKKSAHCTYDACPSAYCYVRD